MRQAEAGIRLGVPRFPQRMMEVGLTRSYANLLAEGRAALSVPSGYSTRRGHGSTDPRSRPKPSWKSAILLPSLTGRHGRVLRSFGN